MLFFICISYNDSHILFLIALMGAFLGLQNWNCRSCRLMGYDRAGVYPSTWPLPLTLEGLKNTQMAPATVAAYSNKRAAEGEPRTTVTRGL